MLKNMFERLGISRSKSATSFSLAAGFFSLLVLLQLFQGLLKVICGKNPADFSEIELCLFAIAEVLFLLAIILAIMSLSWYFNKIYLKSKESFSEFLERLAVKPKKSNYDWRRGCSIFNFIVFILIWILRLVSVLQFSKMIYREICRKMYKTKSRNKNAKRPDIPPIFQELYFTVWVILLIVQIYCDLNCSSMYLLDVYFVIESTTWILYYGVFRRFFEKEYSIYHPLEYLPVILITIPLQAVAYAACLMPAKETLSIGWCNVMPVLLGQAKKDMILPSIFGFLYSAIVISMVIRSFPDEKTKNKNNINSHIRKH